MLEICGFRGLKPLRAALEYYHAKAANLSVLARLYEDCVVHDAKKMLNIARLEKKLAQAPNDPKLIQKLGTLQVNKKTSRFNRINARKNLWIAIATGIKPALLSVLTRTIDFWVGYGSAMYELHMKMPDVINRNDISADYAEKSQTQILSEWSKSAFSAKNHLEQWIRNEKIQFAALQSLLGNLENTPWEYTETEDILKNFQELKSITLEWCISIPVNIYDAWLKEQERYCKTLENIHAEDEIYSGHVHKIESKKKAIAEQRSKLAKVQARNPTDPNDIVKLKASIEQQRHQLANDEAELKSAEDQSHTINTIGKKNKKIGIVIWEKIDLQLANTSQYPLEKYGEMAKKMIPSNKILVFEQFKAKEFKVKDSKEEALIPHQEVDSGVNGNDVVGGALALNSQVTNAAQAHNAQVTNAAQAHNAQLAMATTTLNSQATNATTNAQANQQQSAQAERQAREGILLIKSENARREHQEEVIFFLLDVECLFFYIIDG